MAIRKDNFKDESWYDDLRIFTVIGVCRPKAKQIFSVRRALQELGYNTRTFKRNGEIYISKNLSK